MLKVIASPEESTEVPIPQVFDDLNNKISETFIYRVEKELNTVQDGGNALTVDYPQES